MTESGRDLDEGTAVAIVLELLVLEDAVNNLGNAVNPLATAEIGLKFCNCSGWLLFSVRSDRASLHWAVNWASWLISSSEDELIWPIDWIPKRIAK